MSGACKSTLFTLTIRRRVISRLCRRTRTITRVLHRGARLAHLVGRPGVRGRRGIELVRSVFGKHVNSRLIKLLQVLMRGKRCGRASRMFACFVSHIGRCGGVNATCIASTVRLAPRRGRTIRRGLLSAAGCIRFRVRCAASPTLVKNVIVQVQSHIISNDIQAELRRLAESLRHVRLGMNRYTP